MVSLLHWQPSPARWRIFSGEVAGFSRACGKFSPVYAIGEETGFTGMLLTSFVGAITVVPVMIAFPIVAELMKNGAGIVQMAVFVSTLTTVGIITIPMEIKYLGKKIAILRNVFAFIFSFITAYLVGVLLR